MEDHQEAGAMKAPVDCPCWITGSFIQVPCPHHDGKDRFPAGSFAKLQDWVLRQRAAEVELRLGITADNTGPNVRQLITIVAAGYRVEAARAQVGKSDLYGAAAAFLDVDGAVLQASMSLAVRWIRNAIEQVRSAPGAKAFGGDEEIAGEVLKGLLPRAAALLKNSTSFPTKLTVQ